MSQHAKGAESRLGQRNPSAEPTDGTSLTLGQPAKTRDMLMLSVKQMLLPLGALLIVCFSNVRAADPVASKADGVAYFEKHIRPLLADRCYECHGANEQEASLRLDTYAGMIEGGDSGMLFAAGQPDRSLLTAAVQGKSDDLKMPPEAPLSGSEIAKIMHWIKIGAPHPDAGQSSIKPQSRIDLESGRQHWAFQTPHTPAVPSVEDVAWPKRPIDFFILARLEEKGLHPAPPADRQTLIRRATFDLTGLPPTPEEVEAFLADQSDDAFAKVIDRLLDSAHYGERWGRHWLDVARYADSNGLDENIAHGNAWRYRDYVVAAFNSDKPYDQFLREQLAGDLLPSDEESKKREQLIATGFLSLGPKVLAEVDQTKMEMDIIDEQIDTLGRAVLGLTTGCCRCHDHKFDPLSMNDYYGLAGIFKSTRVMEHYKKIARWWENPIADAEDLELQQKHQQLVDKKKQELERLIKETNAAVIASLEPDQSKPADAKQFEAQYSEPAKTELKRLREELAALEKQPPEMPTAMGVGERDVVDLAVHLRGSHLTLGPIVPRRFPQVLAGTDQPPLPSDQSGRLELAEWLTQTSHPLTGRVMANRIWRWHFGRGIVASVDNFGRLGSRPSHPLLLDWLATEFVENGWSIKHLHREIMLSATYQMSSRYDANAASIDTDNVYYWRFAIRRLEAEAVRDSLLAVSGLLDRTMGGSLLHVKNREFFFNHTSQDTTKYDSYRRSLYLPIVRNHLYDVFQLFDYADASVTNGNRASTTVAPQALFLMNGDLTWQAAEALAARLLEDGTLATDEQRIESLYEIAFSRVPTPTEQERAGRFLGDVGATVDGENGATSIRSQAWTSLCHVVLSSNEFIYVR